MKIALGIEYDGSQFAGWQKQLTQRSVQTCLETALSSVANETIITFCAGRTDTGVHALEQVIHFETSAVRKLDSWIMGTNTLLPDDVKVLWAKEVTENFHARFSATARRYQYVIDNNKTKPAIKRDYLTWERIPLNVDAMNVAGQVLLGEHDFSSFRGKDCQAHTVIRRVELLRVVRQQQYVIIDIQANAFLHHMVRNIVGVLLEIGKNKKPIAWCKEVLLATDRKAASITAPAAGLFFAKVNYPEEFQLPQLNRSAIII